MNTRRQPTRSSALSPVERRQLRQSMAQAIIIMDRAYEHVRRIALHTVTRV